MKEKIINIVVVVIMIAIANYPIYSRIKTVANDVDGVVQTIQSEVMSWHNDINSIQDKVEQIRFDITETINQGLVQTDDVLANLKSLQTETKMLSDKLDSLKTQVFNKVNKAIQPKNVIHKADSVKKQSIDKFRDIIDFKF